MEWLQTITKLPILVKGVLTAEDGKYNTNNSNFDIHFYNFCERLNMCVCVSIYIYIAGFAVRLSIQSGAAGIIVSNHGARQLDYSPSTIMALEEVSPHVYT